MHRWTSLAVGGSLVLGLGFLALVRKSARALVYTAIGLQVMGWELLYACLRRSGFSEFDIRASSALALTCIPYLEGPNLIILSMAVFLLHIVCKSRNYDY